jgi:hypothetical protein
MELERRSIDHALDTLIQLLSSANLAEVVVNAGIRRFDAKKGRHFKRAAKHQLTGASKAPRLRGPTSRLVGVPFDPIADALLAGLSEDLGIDPECGVLALAIFLDAGDSLPDTLGWWILYASDTDHYPVDIDLGAVESLLDSPAGTAGKLQDGVDWLADNFKIVVARAHTSGKARIRVVRF